MDDQRPGYPQYPQPDNWESASASMKYLAEDVTTRLEQVERRLSQLQAQNQLSRQLPNLGIRIFLYSAGILLVLMALVLMVQAFSLLTIPRPAITALVLLAIGAGILAGIRNR